MTEYEYKYAEDIREIATEIIKNDKDFRHIDLNKVVVVRTEKHQKGEHVLGSCGFLSNRTQFLTQKKYWIEFPPVFDELNDAQKKIVVEHELYHIPKDEKGIVPHDRGEFNKIIEKYGLDWIEVYKDAENKVKLLQDKEKIDKDIKKVDKKLKKDDVKH